MNPSVMQALQKQMEAMTAAVVVLHREAGIFECSKSESEVVVGRYLRKLADELSEQSRRIQALMRTEQAEK